MLLPVRWRRMDRGGERLSMRPCTCCCALSPANETEKESEGVDRAPRSAEGEGEDSDDDEEAEEADEGAVRGDCETDEAAEEEPSLSSSAATSSFNEVRERDAKASRCADRDSGVVRADERCDPLCCSDDAREEGVEAVSGVEAVAMELLSVPLELVMLRCCSRLLFAELCARCGTSSPRLCCGGALERSLLGVDSPVAAEQGVLAVSGVEIELAPLKRPAYSGEVKGSAPGAAEARRCM